MKDEQNIIKFPTKTKNANKTQSLSDADINNLFLGLVKLVKNNLEDQVKFQNNFMEKDYRKTLVLLADKEVEIKKLSDENNKMNEKIKRLNEKMQEIRILNMQNLENN